jgi:hypothetical protein
LSRHEADGLETIKNTQPVLVQKLEDEFDLPSGKAPSTPAVAGQVLVPGDGTGSGTAICMFMMQWSRPDIQNATRGCSRMMAWHGGDHQKALNHLMHYVVATKERGLVIAHERIWDGSADFLFRIHGHSDSEYAANTDDRRSVFRGLGCLLRGHLLFFAALLSVLLRCR